MRQLVRTVALFLILASYARAEVFVVDDDGGPGVDFTDLQVAVDSVMPGDVLLVQPGFYPSVQIDKELRVLGQPSETAITHVNWARVRNLPAGQVVVVSKVRSSDLYVADCEGTVIFQGLDGQLRVTDSTDVR